MRIEPAVDSGACVSVVSYERWWNNGCTDITDTPVPDLHDANGQTMDICGETRITMEIDSHLYRVPMFIVRGLDTDMLLGADFLRSTGARLDFRDMTVSLNGNRPIELYLADPTI